MRSEGTAEALGTIKLTCTGISSIQTAITVSVGAPLSATSASPDNKSTFALPALASTAAFAVAPTVAMGASSVTFTFTPTAGVQTFTISGLLANIAGSSLPVGAPVTATVISSTLLSNTLAVATVSNGLAKGSGFPDNPLNIVACSPAIVTPSGAPQTVAGNPDPSPAANSLRVVFAEGFATAFSTAAHEEGGAGGLQGTRLLVQLTGLPAAIIPYAPRALRAASAATTGTVLPGVSTLVLQRVGAPNADGSGGTILAEVADQFDQIPVVGGAATIVYEVTSDSAATVDTATLFIALSVGGSLGPASINGAFSLAPLGPPAMVPAQPQFAQSTSISLNTNQLTLYEFLGTTPAVQTLNIANPGAGVLNWTATIAPISGGTWLALSSSSGAGNASITVSVSPNSLPAGTYNATVTFTAPNALNSPVTLPVSLVVTPRPTLYVTPSALTFTASPGVNPTYQQVTIETMGLSEPWTATVTTSSGGNWLNLSSTTGVTGTSIHVSANSASLAAGLYQGTIAVSATDTSNGPLTISVSLSVGSPTVSTVGPPPSATVVTPAVSANGILNGAAFGSSVAPGAIAAIFGTNLTDGTVCSSPSCGPNFDSNGRVIPGMAGAQVTFNGMIKAPILSTPGSGQLNVQVPVELTGSSATVQITLNGQVSPDVTISLAPLAPGLISISSDGRGQGAILNDKEANLGIQSLVAATGSAPNAHPAAADDVIEIYGTGLGAVTPPVGTGMRPQGNTQTVTTPTVTIGGIPATVVSSGLASCCVGLNQVNVKVPDGISPSNAVPLVLTIGNAASNSVTIAVK